MEGSEQARRQPSGPAAVLLTVLVADPGVGVEGITLSDLRPVTLYRVPLCRGLVRWLSTLTGTKKMPRDGRARRMDGGLPPNNAAAVADCS